MYLVKKTEIRKKFFSLKVTPPLRFPSESQTSCLNGFLLLLLGNNSDEGRINWELC